MNKVSLDVTKLSYTEAVGFKFNMLENYTVTLLA